MKIICLEVHFTTPPLVEAWAARSPGFPGGLLGDKLAELSGGRLADMNDASVDVQVLSLPAPGLEALAPAESVALARDANDRIADAVAAHPDRLQGFVNLPPRIRRVPPQSCAVASRTCTSPPASSTVASGSTTSIIQTSTSCGRQPRR